MTTATAGEVEAKKKWAPVGSWTKGPDGKWQAQVVCRRDLSVGDSIIMVTRDGKRERRTIAEVLCELYDSHTTATTYLCRLTYRP